MRKMEVHCYASAWLSLYHAEAARLKEAFGAQLLAIHHIVSDGWTLGILLRELEALYGAFSRGEASPLAPLPVQYADFAHWQRSWLSGAVLDEHLGYWKERLAGLPAMELATTRRRPQVRTYAGAVAAVKLPARLARELGALSRGEGATLFMTLLSAFFVLLQRYYVQGISLTGLKG